MSCFGFKSEIYILLCWCFKWEAVINTHTCTYRYMFTLFFHVHTYFFPSYSELEKKLWLEAECYKYSWIITSSKDDSCKKKNIAPKFGRMNSMGTRNDAVLASWGWTVNSSASGAASRLGKRIPCQAQKIECDFTELLGILSLVRRAVLRLPLLEIELINSLRQA